MSDESYGIEYVPHVPHFSTPVEDLHFFVLHILHSGTTDKYPPAGMSNINWTQYVYSWHYWI